jgi:iron complex outermembrane receptor protein
LSDSADVDLFPPALVERVEVVADGGSAIYGSDAVAGTVNIIVREPQDLIQSTFQVGIKDGSMDWLASQTLGTTWDAAGSGIGNGGLMLTYQHAYTDPIEAADRGDLYNDDLSPFVGAVGLPPAFSSPGNVRGLGVSAVARATLYPVPSGIGPTQGVTLAQLGAADNPNRQSVWHKAHPLPQITRDTIAGTFVQELTDWLKFSAIGAFTRRSGGATYGSQPNLQSSINVPASNPYSPCTTVVGAAGLNRVNAAGLTCPANNTIVVQYAWANEFGIDDNSEVKW